MNCQSPAAPAVETLVGSRLLSMAIRYFRSSGMPCSRRIGSTCAKMRAERFSIRVLFVCMYVNVISSRSIRSYRSGRSKRTV